MQLNLSKQGMELAFSTIAFAAGQALVWKAMSDILRERKAAAERTNDAFNELRNEERDEELESDVREDQGNEPKVTFTEYAALFAGANDALMMLADGGAWPKPQDPTAVVEYLIKREPRTNNNDVETLKAMLSAYTGGKTVNDADAKALAESDAKERQEYFARQLTENKDDIVTRIKAGVLVYDRNIDSPPVETLLGNLPAKIQLSYIKSIDRKIDFKCSELLTGAKAGGVPSPTARIPKLVRGAMIAELRDDQNKMKEIITRMAHAEDPVTA
jgi:hypothetical protein